MSSTDTIPSVARLPFREPAIAVAFFIVSADVERSRRLYTEILGGGGRCDQAGHVRRAGEQLDHHQRRWRPDRRQADGHAQTPPDPDRVSSFLNLRVADIHAAYSEWSARGAEFLTPPKQHELEIRCYIRDPDGYIIEVGQTIRPEAYVVEA